MVAGSRSAGCCSARPRSALAVTVASFVDTFTTHRNDFVFRTLFALATQIVMFPGEEATGASIARDRWVEETTNMLHAYLT